MFSLSAVSDKMESPPALYDLALKIAFKNCVTLCKCCKTEFRALPDNVLFDFYYTSFLEKRPCFLAAEFSEMEIMIRMLQLKHKRVKLLKSFQGLIIHGSNVLDELVADFIKSGSKDSKRAITVGIKIGGFFNEGGWYEHSIKVLTVVEDLCKEMKETEWVLRTLLECYHKRLNAETIYCDVAAANKTFLSALDVVEKLKQIDVFPNLAGLYAQFSNSFFHWSQYDEAFLWAKRGLLLLHEKLPSRIIIEVLRQASRACVVKRRFNQAGLLIRQAVNLATELYEIDGHPHFSDTLLDFGFYLLNFDSIQESVKVYETALGIRKQVFQKNNIHLALAHEDMAYVQYVNEYTSGRFYEARDNADRAIRLMERILPTNHLMLASAKRVKALILEEIALDIHEGHETHLKERFLQEAEELHETALKLSRKAFGENNVQTAKHYGNLGRLYQSMKKYEQAEKMHLRAIEIKEELLGKNDYEVGLSVGHLASLYNYHMKRYLQAEKLYMRTIEINKNLFGETYSGFEYDYRGLINVYSKLGDVPNVISYSYKLREWNDLRAKAKPPVLVEELLPLKSLIEKFQNLETPN